MWRSSKATSVSWNKGFGWKGRIYGCKFPGGGALKFCSGRYMRPGFPNLGVCERLDCRESGVLWADFQLNQGLENGYFAKFLSFLTKIAVKFRLLKPKITIFSENDWFWRKNVTFFFEMGVLWTELRLNWGGLQTAEDAWKEGLEGRTSPYLLFSWVLPPPTREIPKVWCWMSFWWVDF